MESAKGTNGSVASGHEVDTYLDTRQAARYLDVKSSLLRDLRSRGGGPRFTRIGRLVRYRRDWLDDYAESRSATNTAQARLRPLASTNSDRS
ncbi:MAG: helix-turn-helix domain-containing protein [Hyphomicrobiaceae bacterium]|nr:helix-turn-helix domain-containing protein [Hyphomicrobiaceae bacterium]